MNIFSRVILYIIEARKRIRSYYFCFKYLPVEQAIKLPIFLHVPVKICRLKKGNIIFKGGIESRQINFVEGITGFPAPSTMIYIEDSGTLIFSGKVYISNGCTLRIDEGGVLEFGNDFRMNKNSVIRCADNIVFKDDIMVGWNSELNDSDGHSIFIEGHKINTTAPIIIGNHAWITSHVKISKGVEIADGCIVAKGAVVTKKHIFPNTLIGGIPAKDIKHGIEWEV